MATMDAGWLSLLPPVTAIVLALLTKEVILSLCVGGLLGALVYSGGNGFGMLDTFLSVMAQSVGSNAEILLFLALLGALVAVVTKAGGAHAYGVWAAKHMKTRTGAQLATTALGALIFIDDYFNCLTIGTVMRPVTDAHGVPREKLAYLMDATAAPVCILAPVSTWAAAVAAQIADSGKADGMAVFLQAMPYNLYAWLTLGMAVWMSLSKREFGPMARARASQGGDAVPLGTEGRVTDLLLPILVLVAGAVAALWQFGMEHASKALVTGGFCALIFSFLLFVPRRKLSAGDFFTEVCSGIAAMAGAVVVLVLAWTLSGICADLLGTGKFVGRLLSQGHVPMTLLPAAAFLAAGGLSFAVGTSWGTFGILLPIVIEIVTASGRMDLLAPIVAAVLAGAVFGDHCSPLSDTTILSAAGAGCGHVAHVSTQIPYALIVGGCSLIGYLWMAAGRWYWAALPISAGLLSVVLLCLLRNKKTAYCQ